MGNAKFKSTNHTNYLKPKMSPNFTCVDGVTQFGIHIF